MIRRLPWRHAGHMLLGTLRLGMSLCAPLILRASAHADGGPPNLAYVAGGGARSEDLVVMDVAQRRVTAHIAVGGNPAGVILSADSRFAYVTQAAAGRVAIVDTCSRRVVATVPVGAEPRAMALDVSRTPNLLYVAVSGGDTVAVVDPTARRVLTTIHVGQRPSGLAIAFPGSGSGAANPNAIELYVANTASNTVSVINLASRKVVAVIPVPGGPLGVVAPPPGTVAYVSTQAGTVVALSLIDHRFLGTLLRLRGGPLGTMDYNAVTDEVYVPDQAAGEVAVLSPISAPGAGATPVLPVEPERTLLFSGGPAAAAITFDGAYGFVAERESGQLAMFDVATRRLLTTVAVGGTPQAVVTGAYPPTPASQGVNPIFYVASGLVGIALLGGIAFIWRRPLKIREKNDV